MLCCSCFSCNISECEEPLINNSATEEISPTADHEVTNNDPTGKINCPSCQLSVNLSDLQKHLLNDHKELSLSNNRFYLTNNTQQLHILTDTTTGRHFLLWTDTNNSEFSCMCLHLAADATPARCAVTLKNVDTHTKLTKTTSSCFICNRVGALEKVVRFHQITSGGSPENIECQCEFECEYRCFANCHVYGTLEQYVAHLKAHESFPVYEHLSELHVDENVYFMVVFGVVFMCVVSEDFGSVEVGFDGRYKGCFTVHMRECGQKSKLMTQRCNDWFIWYCFEWHLKKYVIKVVKAKHK